MRTFSLYKSVVLPALSCRSQILASPTSQHRANARRHTKPRINILISFFAQTKLVNHDIPAPIVKLLKMSESSVKPAALRPWLIINTCFAFRSRATVEFAGGEGSLLPRIRQLSQIRIRKQ